MHLPRDLQAQLLQALLRAAGFILTGLLSRSYRCSQGDEDERNKAIKRQSYEVFLGCLVSDV